MTGFAVHPKCQDMFLGKGIIHLQVAVGTGQLVEGGGISPGVAIFTSEGRTV
jgi:hypothetical protein